jgi:hypothetical protein
MDERQGQFAIISFVRAQEICCPVGKLFERIRDDREPYYKALKECDIAWEAGKLDLSSMEDFLAGLLQAQLEDEGLLPQFGTGPRSTASTKFKLRHYQIK